MNIKNIIFDLGGVLLPLDIGATQNAFETLGGTSFTQAYSQLKQTAFFDEFDKGKISAADFRKNVRLLLHHPVSDAQIDNAWNAMLGVIPQARVEYLIEIRKHFRVVLLSNTNTIHIDAFMAMHEAVYGKNSFEKLFSRIYFSSDVGMRKPDAEIFEFVVNDAAFEKSETIFIDDSPQHVTGAVSAGLTAFHLNTKSESVEQLIEEITGYRHS